MSYNSKYIDLGKANKKLYILSYAYDIDVVTHARSASCTLHSIIDTTQEGLETPIATVQ